MPKDGEVTIPIPVGGVPSPGGGSNEEGCKMEPGVLALLYGSAGQTIQLMNQGSAHYAEDARRQWLQNSTQVTQQGALANRMLSGPHMFHGAPEPKA